MGSSFRLEGGRPIADRIRLLWGDRLAHRYLFTACLALIALGPGGVRAVESGSVVAEAATVESSPSSEVARAADSLLVDPWLTEAGPILPAAPQAITGRDRVVEVWQATATTPAARTEALRRLRLEFGLGDLRAPARVVQAAASNPHDPSVATDLALEIAPGMPALLWARVGDLWDAGEYGESVRAFGRLLVAGAGDLEVQLWALGNGLLLAWLVALCSSGALIAMLAVKRSPDAAHDLADPLSGRMPGFARTALLAALLLVPVWLGEGLAGFVLACFALCFVWGTTRERTALALAAVAWVVALHPLAQWASVVATATERDPLVRSALSVTTGTASTADFERLEAAFPEDLVAAHAVAYHARRLGRADLGLERLDRIEESHPRDPVVLANRGNLEMRAGRAESAIGYYERAVVGTSSPALLFSLSQAYASVLRIDESEAALLRAQGIADREVAAFSSLSDPSLVADVAFPLERVRERLRRVAHVEPEPVVLSRAIAPGWLGRDASTAVLGFALVAVVGIFASKRFDRSSACTRCGQRICARCSASVWSDDLCEDCHYLFRNPDATDPKLRMARMQLLSRRETWRGGLITLASLIVPGVAGLAVRRPDLALFSLALFAWGVAWLRWPEGALPDANWLGEFAPVAIGVSGSLALAAYVAISLISLAARRNR